MAAAKPVVCCNWESDTYHPLRVEIDLATYFGFRIVREAKPCGGVRWHVQSPRKPGVWSSADDVMDAMADAHVPMYVEDLNATNDVERVIQKLGLTELYLNVLEAAAHVDDRSPGPWELVTASAYQRAVAARSVLLKHARSHAG